jgi:2-polyprenyl-3-methyl-5-hydroxy-6-metoxy-1,4-benzoquinol methylase
MEIVEKYVQKGTALNVGAMNGAIKVLEDRGWNLHIVEVSEHAAKTARQLWGFNVTVSRIEDFDCAPETFDFIKLGHVIEHLADPRFALEKMYRMLRPGGVILIDTDNADGFKTKLEVTIRKVFGEQSTTQIVKKITGKNLRKRYGRLTPPEHLYCFNEKSLTTLLQTVGFKILEVVKTSWGDATWFPLVNEKFSPVEKGLLALDTVGAKFGLGEVIAVLAIKK